MGTFIGDRDEKPLFNPKDRILDDKTLAVLMAALQLSGREQAPEGIETAYWHCLKKVERYRRSEA